MADLGTPDLSRSPRHAAASGEDAGRGAVPRSVRGYVRRVRLDRALDLLTDRGVVLVIAPQGAGKTQLLAHWRRLLMGGGVAVVWVGVDKESTRVQALDALRTAVAATCDEAAAAATTRGVDGVLSAIARFGRRLVLIMDGVEGLGREAGPLLSDLVAQAPPNMQLILAGRLAPDMELGAMAGYGRLAMLDGQDLRFTDEEAASLLEARLGPAFPSEALSRLLEITAGWAAALTLAARTVEQAQKPEKAVEAFGAATPPVAQLLEACLEEAPPEVRRILKRAYVLDQLEPGLVEAVSGVGDAFDKLRAFAAATPILVQGENRDVLRLHPLARQFFALSERDREPSEALDLHRRAAEWLAAQDRAVDATPHALAAGDTAMACDLLEKCLVQTVDAGRVLTALDWYRMLPPNEIALRGPLQASAAWAFTISGDLEQVQSLLWAADSVHPGGVSPERKALMHCVLASHADDPDLAKTVLARYPDMSGLPPPAAAVYENLRRWIAQQSGEPRSSISPHMALADPLGLPGPFHTFCFTVFRDAEARLGAGQAEAAVKLVRSLLDSADVALGRCSAPSLILAPALAAAYWQAGAPARAKATLAGRSAGLERHSMPEGLWLGMSALARIALAEGDGSGAMSILMRLETIAANRNLFRIRALAQRERIKTLLKLSRPATAYAIVEGLRETLALAGDGDSIRGRLVALACALGTGHAAIGMKRWSEAQGALSEAERLARLLNRNRDLAEIMLLRSLTPEGAPPDAGETLGAIESQDLVQLACDLGAPLTGVAVEAPASAPMPPPALTAAEIDVLELLGQGLSNKAIARALCLSDETVKWHLRNIYQKVDAHDRGKAVQRARELGLLP